MATKKKVFSETQTKIETTAFEVDTNVEKFSSCLENIKVTVVCGGGIAAVEVPRFVRELRRHGATTQICLTENALKFIGLESMRWASQNEVILQPSGLSEHICTSDVVVVVPATADLISKIKNGICSDAATTLVQSALGMKKPIIFCQTMHDSLAQSPIIMENKKYLINFQNVFFINPREEEGKQKIPLVETLAMNVCHIVNQHKYKIKKHILLTYGGTRTMIDPVRCIANLSTGATGMEVAKLFYGMGYNLTVLAANTNVSLPLYDNMHFHSLPNYKDMYEFCAELKAQQYDGLIHLVAASDFELVKPTSNKISSEEKNFALHLTQTKKLLTTTKLKDIVYRAAAKLTTHSHASDETIKIAQNFLVKNNLNAVFCNTAMQAWQQNSHSGIFLERVHNKVVQTPVFSKKEIAQCYFNSFIR